MPDPFASVTTGVVPVAPSQLTTQVCVSAVPGSVNDAVMFDVPPAGTTCEDAVTLVIVGATLLTLTSVVYSV